MFAYMVKRARFKDHLYFCSDATAAKALGLSPRTIRRCRRRLEQEGRIVRVDDPKRMKGLRKTVVYSFPKGVRRLPKKVRAKPTAASVRHAEYIKSDQWKKIRDRYYSRRPRECVVCGSSGRLHLHHLTYERYGHERITDLVALCPKHHRATHQAIERGADPRKAHLEVGGRV